jgi:hypothetical protein
MEEPFVAIMEFVHSIFILLGQYETISIWFQGSSYMYLIKTIFNLGTYIITHGKFCIQG